MIVALPPLPPPAVEATATVSSFVPLSTVIVCPTAKPTMPATEYRRARVGGASSITCRADGRYQCRLEIRAAIDRDRLTCAEFRDVAHLLLARRSTRRPALSRCRKKSSQLLSVSARPSGTRPMRPADSRAPATAGTAAAAASAPAATLAGSRDPVVTLGRPRIDDTAVVETVNNQTGGVTQHYVAGAA